MMSFLEGLREHRESINAHWLAYINAKETLPRTYHVFLEGFDDNTYYLPYLRQSKAGHPYVNYKCKSKKNVYKLFNKIYPSLKAEKPTLFMVDSDLDLHVTPYPNSPDIFETDHYSFENYLVGTDSLRIVWTELFGLSIADPRLARYEFLFAQVSLRALKTLRFISAWTILNRRRGNEIVLGNIDIKKIITVTLIFERLDISNITRYLHQSQNLPYSPDDTTSAIAIIKQELKQLHPKSTSRGKWEFFVFQKFLAAVYFDLFTTNKLPEVPKKGVDCMQGALFLTSIANRLPIPKNLQTYFDLH